MLHFCNKNHQAIAFVGDCPLCLQLHAPGAPHLSTFTAKLKEAIVNWSRQEGVSHEEDKTRSET